MDAHAANAPPGLGRARILVLYLAFAVLSLTAYQDALRGPFVSDDELYLVEQSAVPLITSDDFASIFEPNGDAAVLTMNYAPVHLLLCAVERTLFGSWTLGYHVVNVLLHAANALLLTLLFVSSGIPLAAAALGGLLFLLHPAQVEAVAWMSQLKTLAAFALGFSALACLWKRPALATLLFALALLTKFVVATLVVAAAGFVWVRPQLHGRRIWPWLAGWTALALLTAWPQFESFKYSGSAAVPPFEDAAVALRTMAATGARYIAMALGGSGLSTLHEPAPARAWTDGWFLLAVPLGLVLAFRMLAGLRDRREEGAWWLCACAGFAPVCQLFPFYYPLADRYLYFILPGLLGGALLAATSAGAVLESRLGEAPVRVLRGATVALALAVALLFGLRTADRSQVWRSVTYIDQDAAANYPNGTTALFLQAAEASQRHDPAAAVAALRRAEALRPLNLVRPVHVDPRLAAIRDSPEYADYLQEIARRRIEIAEQANFDHPIWLRSTAAAHGVLGEHDQAIAVLERAMREGGNKADLMMDILKARQARRAAREAGAN